MMNLLHFKVDPEWIAAALFYFYAAVLIGAACSVVLSRNPVRGVLSLVLAFVAAAAMWLVIEVEFLAWVLILVYVGAVMTLFLFVVMMLDIDLAELRSGFVRFLPLAVVVVGGVLGILISTYSLQLFGHDAASYKLVRHAADYSNVMALGNVLYTEYVYPFILAGVLLLVAIIAAIGLTFRGPRGRLAQNIGQQIAAKKADRLRIVSDADLLGKRK